MLKVRDNIDLKELEKYGFRKHIKAYYKVNRKNYIKNTPNGYIEVNFETRRIILDYINFLITDENIYQDTLYDLIKLDLVEKVGE